MDRASGKQTLYRIFSHLAGWYTCILIRGVYMKKQQLWQNVQMG
jgi:hypothetical protein